MRIFLTAAIASTLAIAGCGGGGGGPEPAQKSAQLTFALISSAQPRIESFRITVNLPAGVSVATKAGGYELDSTAVEGKNGSFVLGTYSAAVHRVRISGVKPDGFFGPPNTGSYSAGGSIRADAVKLNCSLSVQNPLFSYSMLGASLSGGNTALQDQTSNSALSVTYGY